MRAGAKRRRQNQMRRHWRKARRFRYRLEQALSCSAWEDVLTIATGSPLCVMRDPQDASKRFAYHNSPGPGMDGPIEWLFGLIKPHFQRKFLARARP
jgi:hypothetical protein